MRFPFVAIIVLASLALVLVARADDPPAAEVTKPDEPLETRVYDVSAITMGQTAFPMDRHLFPPPADQVNDIENPLFGGEAMETCKLFGSIDDVVEIVKRRDPRAFEREGVSILANWALGIHVVGPPRLQRTVASALSELARDVLTIATFDVVVLRGDISSVESGGLAAAVVRGQLRPLAGARASGSTTMQSVVRVGADRAYVIDQDTEVACHATSPDPIVGVVREGLEYKVDVVDISADRVDVRFDGRWRSSSEPRRSIMRPSGAPVETFDVEARRAAGLFTLSPGAWTVIPSSGDVCFAVRATVRTPVPAASWPGERWRIEPVADAGPLALRSFDLRDLATPVTRQRGVQPYLSPSNYTPPEPPELSEAAPAVPMDAAMDAIRRIITPPGEAPEDWVLTPAFGRISLAVTQGQADAIQSFIDALRHSVRSTRLRATVVELPVESIPEYWAGLDDGAGLLADGIPALLARPRAHVVERAEMRVAPQQRNAVFGGRERSYVGDYDANIAEGTEIGDPVVRSVLDGFSFDIESAPAPGFDAIACTLRIDRSNWRGSRLVATQHGEIECPTLGISRICGGTVVPIGSARIVGATLESGVLTLTIVEASVE